LRKGRDKNMPDTHPKHIAIIMDGNRRWAKNHHLPVLVGHWKVADEVVEPLIDRGYQLGFKYMTFWAWSTENWQRNKREVEGVMKLFRHILKNRWDALDRKGYRIRTIGDISQFAIDIKRLVQNALEKTKNNTRMDVIFALNYGGRDEIVRAVRQIVHRSSLIDNRLTNNYQLSMINDKLISSHLDTAGIPDPEIIVRTGGEQRTSGFLLWQSEYSEWFFPRWLMPEFTPEKLDNIIKEFHDRNRRFGK
jgi:undecaprenyl diphosphate synthase